MECPECGMPLEDDIDVCPLCGAAVQPQNIGKKKTKKIKPKAGTEEPVIDMEVSEDGTITVNEEDIYRMQRLLWPEKSKTTAALLALFLGGIGAHYFYLGKPWRGVLYIIFCWTYVPAVLAFVQAVIMLLQKDEDFERKWHVRCRRKQG